MLGIMIQEHLAFQSNAGLEEICGVLQQTLNVEEFLFDRENETEWGKVRFRGIELNVSKPYENGALQEWDNSVPMGCNFGVVLTFKNKTKKEDRESQVDQLGEAIAAVLERPVYYHRTWLGPGKNVSQQKEYPERGA